MTITPPAEEPVTLDAAKLHCVVSDDAEDDLFAGWIKAAREMAENCTGRRWIDQSVRLTLADWPCDEDGVGGAIRLPVRPATAVTRVAYYATNGTLTELAEGTDWQVWLDHAPPLLAPAPAKVWPPVQPMRLGAVTVEFNAGYEDTADVPERVRQAILLSIGYWHGHRGDSDDPTRLASLPYTLGMPAGARALLDSLMTGAY